MEIWNEENTVGFWPNGVNASAYAQLYAAARTAIHAVQPTEQVVVGGLAGPIGTGVSYLQSFLTAVGGVNNVDAVAVHPYDSTATETIDDVVEYRTALDAAGGANVPIDVTEFGWPTTMVSYAVQGSDIATVAKTLYGSDCGVEGIYPFSWATYDGVPTDVSEWFGITHLGAATASTAAVSAAFGALESEGTPSSADSTLCGRPMAVTVKVTKTAPTTIVQKVFGALADTRKGQEHKPRVKLVHARRICLTTSVLTSGATSTDNVGVAGAVVQLTGALDRTLTTNATGQSVVCFDSPLGHKLRVAAAASDSQFNPAPDASLSVATGKAP
jgi:hypothetical protein